MRFRRITSPPLSARIELVSLIDVLFILLFFMVLNAQFRLPVGLPLELPPAVSAGPQHGGSRMILVDRDDRIVFGGEALTLELLRQRLKPLARSTPVVLQADRRASYGVALGVFDLLRDLEFPSVTLWASPAPPRDERAP